MGTFTYSDDKTASDYGKMAARNGNDVATTEEDKVVARKRNEEVATEEDKGWLQRGMMRWPHGILRRQ